MLSSNDFIPITNSAPLPLLSLSLLLSSLLSLSLSPSPSLALALNSLVLALLPSVLVTTPPLKLAIMLFLRLVAKPPIAAEDALAYLDDKN